MKTIKINIKNQDNENIVCEINKSEISASVDKPTVLILHALTGNKENRTINFLAKNLPEHGFDTIQFDLSGHGESEGRMENASIAKQLEDINAVLRQVTQVKTNRIIIVGNSFSVITALAFAKNNESVAGLILLSGRANYLKYIENLEKIDDKYKLTEDVFVDESFIEDYKKYNPVENIKFFKGPVLIIHGEKDEVIPKEDAELFYASAKSKKDIFLIPGAGHRYSEQKDKVLDKIIEFLNKFYK